MDKKNKCILLVYVYLEALNSAFKEHEEGGVWINSLPLLKNRFGFQQASLCVCVVQSKEWLHYRVVPQEGQTVRTAQTL